MADGRTKPLAEVRAGDEIYGTVRQGYYRRYALTTVLAHWSTVKPAYRVILEDGTQLISSGDHRFLTERGWKHVTGTEQGPLQRPHLTVNNKLMGVGGFAEPPKETAAYRRGYLCGMIRGDGHIGHYPNGTPTLITFAWLWPIRKGSPGPRTTSPAWASAAGSSPSLKSRPRAAR